MKTPHPLDLSGIDALFSLPDATPEVVRELISGAKFSEAEKRIIWPHLTPEQRAWLKG